MAGCDAAPCPDDAHVLFERVVPDELPSYKFHIIATQHDALRAAAYLLVTVLHHGHAVGELHGLLIDRDVRPAWHFFKVCAGHSARLYNLAVSLCDSDGRLRCADVDGVDAMFDAASDRGGFVYVAALALDAPHRGRDVGLRCLHALLRALDGTVASHPTIHPSFHTTKPGLRLHWTLAALYPTRAPPSPTFGDHEFHYPDSAAGAMRHFARLGFRQTARGSAGMYLIPRRHALLPKTSLACFVPSAMPRDLAHPDDEPLRAFFRSLRTNPGLSVADFARGVRQAVENGAQPRRTCALHMLVQCGGVSTERVAYLCGTGGVCLDARDARGRTALHIAAERAVEHHVEPHLVPNLDPNVNVDGNKSGDAVRVVQTLLGLGASTELRDVRGDTPARAVERAVRARIDLISTFTAGARPRRTDFHDANLVRQLLLSGPCRDEP